MFSRPPPRRAPSIHASLPTAAPSAPNDEDGDTDGIAGPAPSIHAMAPMHPATKNLGKFLHPKGKGAKVFGKARATPGVNAQKPVKPPGGWAQGGDAVSRPIYDSDEG